MRNFGLGTRFVRSFAAGVTACSIAIAAAAGCFPAVVSAAVINQGGIDRHNYEENYGMPSPIYITGLDDGGYMTFDAGQLYYAEEPYTVNYYDSSFNHVKTKLIDYELENFGCFYADSTGYYLLTGQENGNQSAEVECVRLTKYDKDWKVVGRCGFKDINTLNPFAFGGASITSSGEYMVIRTCHVMYKSSDGLNHQANMTFLVDTSSMTRLDARYGVSNESTGYCSHSFNEYVKIEDNHIIAADHGDGYPRGMGIWYYKTDLTTGKIGGNTTLYMPYTFDGGCGQNYTGATLGGLEISDTSYIIVGTSIDQSRFASESKYHDDSEEWHISSNNVFLSAVNKSTGETSTKWLTADANRSMCYLNPFIVKINNNKFAVIWSKHTTIYYVFIDGEGNTLGPVKSSKGILTECQPILSGDKIVWYAKSPSVVDSVDCNDWLYYPANSEEDEAVCFFSIDTNDGGFSAKVLYGLDVDLIKHGKALISHSLASAGTEITVNVTPDEGYELDLIRVNGKTIEGNKFTMPGESVIVDVYIKKIGSPGIGETVTADDFKYTVLNSDPDGAGTVFLSGVANETAAVSIPSSVEINKSIYKVTRIGASAFRDNKTVRTVYIGSGILTIDDYAFAGSSNLVKVSGGAGLKTIGSKAFAFCPKLKSFTITSSNLSKIGPYAFSGDKRLKTLNIKKTTKLTKSGVKKSLKGSKVKTVKVKKSKVWKYKKYFKKSNSGKKVKVKK